MGKEGVEGQANVFDDLPEENRGNILPGMEWDRGPAPIRMAVLPMRATLTDELEAQDFQNTLDLRWFEDGNMSHAYDTDTRWMPTNSLVREGGPSSRSM